MKIGIIGAGNIAGTVGVLWAKAGHPVLFGSRHPDGLGPLLDRAGPNAQAGTIEDAARFGDVIFCSTPFGAWPDLARTIAPLVAGKVVIDSANPYPERDGTFAREALNAGEGTGSKIARLLPGARFARAFSSVYFKTLESEAHRAGDQVGIPIAGDTDAVAVASQLVREAGFAPVRVGGIERAVLFDPGTPVYNTGMSGPALAKALGLGEALTSEESRA